MAENKTINIKINSNTKEATKDTKDYNKAIGSTKKQYDAVLKSGDSYEKQLSDINKIVKETPLNVRDMNKQIQAYQSIALSAGRETPVGKEALKKASELRDRYIDIQNETKRLADDQKNLQGAIQLIGTGVAAFGGVQSAMALTGVESEKLRETMVKLQAAQTLMTSINQIATAAEKESSAMLLLKSIRTKVLASSTYAYATAQGVATKGAKLLRVAMVSTGVGALVVGVGLLIANFDKLISVFKPIIQGLKDFGDAIGLTNFAEDKLEEQREARFKEEATRHQQALTNAGKEREAIRNLIQAEKDRQTEIENSIDLELRKAKGNAKEIEELEKKKTQSKKDSLDEEVRLFKEAKLAQINEEQKGIDEFQGIIDRNLARGRTDHAKELAEVKRRSETLSRLKASFLNQDYEELKNFNVRRENLELDYDDGVEQRRKERASKYKSYLQDRLNTTRQIEDLENSLLEDGIEKELAINEDKFRRLREDAKKNTKLTAKERAALKDLYDKQELAQQKVINQKYVDLEKEKNAKIDEVNEKANQDRIDKEDALFQLELDLMKDRQTAEIIALSQSYEAKYLLAQDNAELTKQLEEQFLIDQAAIEDKFRDEKTAKDKAASDKKIADIEAERLATIQAIQEGFEMAQKGADATQALGDAVFAHKMANVEKGSKEEEELARKQFKFNKALQLGGAIIDAGKAITASLAQSPIAIGAVPNPAGIASLAFAATTSAANIAKIAASKFDSPGSATTPSPSGENGGGEAQAPSFNVVGDSSINQIAQLQQTPVQAFVVSGEVTTSQALDRNRVQNATL